MSPAGAPPTLLFRQYCLLAGAAGVFALREPLGAGAALAALILFQGAPLREYKRAIALAICFTLGLGWAALREPQPPPVPAWLEQAAAPTISPSGDRLPPAPVALFGRVRSCDPLPEGRLRLILDNLRPAGDPATPAYPGGLMVTFNTPVPRALAGMEARLTLRVSAARSSLNPQLPDRDRLLADSEIFFIGGHGKNMPLPEYSGRANLGEAFREALETRFLAALTTSAGDGDMLGRPSGYAPALIFNDRSNLTAGQLQRLADTGIIHSLALSGMHLGYAAAVGCILLWGLARCRPGIFLRFSRPRAAVLAGLPTVLLCLWLGQAPVTLIRAFFMFLFWGLLIFLGRPKVLLDGLTAALGLMILLSPTALFDLRLQLSFAAVGTIALALPAVTALVHKLFPRPGSRLQIREAGAATTFLHSCLSAGCILFLLSSAIQIALLPLTASGFTAVPVFAPLNVVWLPILGFWVMPLLYVSLGLCLVAPGPAAFTLSVACLPLEALDALLVFLDQHELLRNAALPRPHPLSALGWWLALLLGGKLLYRLLGGKLSEQTNFSKLICSGGRRNGLRLALTKSIISFFRQCGDRTTSATLFLAGSSESPLVIWRYKHFQSENALDVRRTSTRKRSPALLALAGLAALGMIFAPIYLAAPGKDEARLTVLDVGAGQAVLLEWSAGRVLLDGGPAFPGGADMGRFITGPAAAYNAWPKLDLVLASHPDADHLGGLLFVLEHFQVKTFGGNGHTARPEIAERLDRALAHAGLRERTYTRGDIVELPGGMRLEILWPPDEPALKGNNASLVVRIVHRGRPLAVVCGDAERPALERLARLDGQNLSAPVLILPHHGSAGALCPDFYRAVGPRLAVTSSRLANQWGFPSKKVRDALAEQGVPLLDTGECGQIRIIEKSSDPGLAVHTARERVDMAGAANRAAQAIPLQSLRCDKPRALLGRAAPNPAWGE